jgi:hypothetical protein
MRKIVIGLAATAALMALPAPASALETSYIAFGVLIFDAGNTTVDSITTTEKASSWSIADTATPNIVPGIGCFLQAAAADCDKTFVLSLRISTHDLDDTVAVTIPVPATIDGGSGGDVLTGGPLADTIRGGDGDDRIFARDGVVDTIDCGVGDDRAVVDANDVVTNCEVDAPVVDPVVAPKPLAQTKKGEDKKLDEPKDADAKPRGVDSPLPGVSPVSLVAGAVQVGRDGTAPITLGCAETEVAGCVGDVFLDPAPAAKATKKGKGKHKVRALAARRGRFGRSPFQIAAGKKKNLKVSLSTEARRQLGLPTGKRARAARRGRRVKAVVTVVQRGKTAQRSVVELRG